MRKRTYRRFAPVAIIAGFILLFSDADCFSAAPEEFEKGKVIEKVVCRDFPDQSYALYLPSDFTPTVKRPVLYLFDPRAQGAAAVEAFRTAAEKFGWICAASNNSQSGPAEPSLKASWAMFKDSTARFPIDETRIYAGGFSAGARTASIFPLAIKRQIAGIIGIGAGISTGTDLERLGTSFFCYFGIVGLADFNYQEMKQLDANLDGANIPHHVLFHEGPHGWPDAEACARAIGWMEIMAMKQGSGVKDEARIDEMMGKDLAEASALAAAGRTYWAARQYAAVSELFEGLRDSTSTAAEANRLKQSPDYAEFLKAEKERDERSASLRKDFGRAFAVVEEAPTDRMAFIDILRDLNLGSLRKEAKEARAPEDRGLALRNLFLFSIDAGRKGYERYANNDWLRAASYYKLAAESCLDNEPRLNLYYRNLASVYSLLDDRKTALKYLETAVDKGYSNFQELEKDEDLANIRKTAKFRQLIEQMKKK